MNDRHPAVPRVVERFRERAPVLVWRKRMVTEMHQYCATLNLRTERQLPEKNVEILHFRGGAVEFSDACAQMEFRF